MEPSEITVETTESSMIWSYGESGEKGACLKLEACKGSLRFYGRNESPPQFGASCNSFSCSPSLNKRRSGTVMLPKTCTPESPLDLRPITILSRIYRQWSRYKAVALLVELSKRLPNVIAAGTQGMSALTLNVHFQELLESELQDTEANGVTIDIKIWS